MAENRKPVISVRNLAKNYGELKVLRKIDMNIYKFAVFAALLALLPCDGSARSVKLGERGIGVSLIFGISSSALNT